MNNIIHISEKYTLDTMKDIIEANASFFKDSLKSTFIHIEDFKKAPIVDEDEARDIIESKKPSIVGVDYFDSKKVDFYLLSTGDFSIPIAMNTKMVINDKSKLISELINFGYEDSLKVDLISKSTLLKDKSFRDRYGVKSNCSTEEFQKLIMKENTDLKYEKKDSSYFRKNKVEDWERILIPNIRNPKLIKLYEDLKNFIIKDEDIARKLLEKKGFINILQNDKILRYLDKQLSSIPDDVMEKSEFYSLVSTSKLELKTKIVYDEDILSEFPFLRADIDSSQLKSILKEVELENAFFQEDGTLKVNRPIETIEEFDKFLSTEEYIRKTIQSSKENILEVNSIKSLDNVMEQNIESNTREVELSNKFF